MRLFAMCAILMIVIQGTVAAQDASKRSLVARLKNVGAEDCGCSFQRPGPPQNKMYYLFFSRKADAEKIAWMNIDGNDVKLTLVRKTDPRGKARAGSKWTRRYVAEGISVEATYIASQVCKGNFENCDWAKYFATFVVRKGDRTQVVKAVGECGC